MAEEGSSAGKLRQALANTSASKQQIARSGGCEIPGKAPIHDSGREACPPWWWDDGERCSLPRESSGLLKQGRWAWSSARILATRMTKPSSPQISRPSSVHRTRFCFLSLDPIALPASHIETAAVHARDIAAGNSSHASP